MRSYLSYSLPSRLHCTTQLLYDMCYDRQYPVQLMSEAVLHVFHGRDIDYREACQCSATHVPSIVYLKIMPRATCTCGQSTVKLTWLRFQPMSYYVQCTHWLSEHDTYLSHYAQCGGQYGARRYGLPSGVVLEAGISSTAVIHAKTEFVCKQYPILFFGQHSRLPALCRKLNGT